jgi:HK97 family phage major capsid protein
MTTPAVDTAKKQLVSAYEAILSKAEAEKRDLTDEEFSEARMLEDALHNLGKEAPAGNARKVKLSAGSGSDVRPYGEIGPSYRKLFYGNDRTAINRTETAEDFCLRALTTRTMLAGTMAAGGADVPEYWWESIYSDAYQESIALPRVKTFKMEGPTLHVPAMDSESQDEGFAGGVSGSWVSEAEANSDVTPKTRMVTLSAVKLMMFVNASRELIEDSRSLSSLLGQQMTYGVTQMVDEAILTGDGIGKPLGVLNAPATISVNRSLPNKIGFADVAAMYSRLHPVFFKGAVWVANPSTLPQLLVMQDAASQYIWAPSMGMTSGAINTALFGLPVLFSDKVPALGTEGDLMLCNFGNYAFGLRQGAQLESTNAARWSNDETSFRVCIRCNGHPLLDNAITPRTGGNTLSAFVVLN